MFLRDITIKNVEEYREKLYSTPLLKTEGIIKYNPERKGLKSNATCCIIELDSGITDYYRYCVNKYYGINLIKPNWNPHISIIQGEEALLSEKNTLWKKHEGKEIEILYYPFPRYSGDTDQKYGAASGRFWFLTIKCSFINKLRGELNLGNIKTPHLTIGKNKEK